MADAHGSGYTTSVNLQNFGLSCKNTKNFINADMAELADAHGSGPCESNFMQVQVLLSAPKKPDFIGLFAILGIKNVGRRVRYAREFVGCFRQIQSSEFGYNR